MNILQIIKSNQYKKVSIEEFSPYSKILEDLNLVKKENERLRKKLDTVLSKKPIEITKKHKEYGFDTVQKINNHRINKDDSGKTEGCGCISCKLKHKSYKTQKFMDVYQKEAIKLRILQNYVNFKIATKSDKLNEVCLNHKEEPFTRLAYSQLLKLKFEKIKDPSDPKKLQTLIYYADAGQVKIRLESIRTKLGIKIGTLSKEIAGYERAIKLLTLNLKL